MGSARKNQKGKHQPQLRSRTTRSSKGRLLTDSSPAQSTQLLSTQLRALGLYAADTLGDGNCLFRALSDQLYGSPSRHAELRARVCDWIGSHRDRYEPFVEDERGLEVHLKCMRENGTYGGHLELSAFAHLARRNVKVIQPGLVYVIEWAALASLSSSQRDEEEDNDEADYDEDDQDLDERERRRRHRDRARHVKEAAKSNKSAKKGGKIKPPLPPEDNPVEEKDEGDGDTIYVAYHDWEHFSSIRNLRGPHVGLPVVRETPPPPVGDLTPPAKIKETETEKKKKKVTLKLGSASLSPTAVTITASTSPTAMEVDPATIPLPASRSASPFLLTTSNYSSSSLAPHPLRASFLPPSSPHEHSASRPATRSPKRSFDEDEGESDASSLAGGRSKRTRRVKPQLMDVDADGDPSLSSSRDSGSGSVSPSDSSPLTSMSSSSSPVSSASSSSASSPEPEVKQIVTAPLPQVPSRPLTRRQRKMLGLPKPRAPIVGNDATTGKIVIPGGKFRKSGEGEEGEDRGEWTRNGAGRVDVRGFRELKI